MSEPLISEPPTTLDDLLSTYNSTLTRLLDKHAPLIHKPVTSRPSNPWFTPFLSSLKATRRRIEKAWIKYKDSHLLVRLRQITHFYHHSIVLAKKAYNSALVIDSKSHPRKLWQTITVFYTGNILLSFHPHHPTHHHLTLLLQLLYMVKKFMIL